MIFKEVVFRGVEVVELEEIAELIRLSKEYNEKVESVLRPPAIELKPYKSREVTLFSGEKMLIRQAERRDIPRIADFIRPLITLERDYYDIVGTRTYGELLGWKYQRYRNIWFIVGEVEGKIVGVADGRLYNEKIGISLHTIADPNLPGTGIGAHLAAAKWEHFFEYLGVEEVWITAESPRGLNDILKWKPKVRTDVQHELGGGTVYVITRERYEERKADRKRRLGW
ncbi:MAG: hypothetical protein DRO52_00830 [Candidatus Hecatellales archaeon]|nr:MAG: hypothetical protein DRO52_00830 [Candidatus Hecatellales archaeon]